MNRKTVGAILFVFLGLIVILVLKFWWDFVASRDRDDVVIGTDNYLGYWHATQSNEFVKMLLQREIGHQFVPDEADYHDRLQRLKNKELDMILLPVSSYVLHGADEGYPGVIVASCSESRGADGILVRADKFPEGKVEDLDDPNIKIALTKDSPSEDLMSLTTDMLDFVHLSSSTSWLVEANGSADAVRMLVNGDVDAAVGWEPDLSVAMAKHPGKFKVIWSSENFQNAIIDVFVVRADYLKYNREVAVKFFRSYFQVMNEYVHDRDKLLGDIADTPDMDLSREDIDTTIRKIDWYTLGENCREQFGITGRGERVLDCILYWRMLYRKTGRLGQSDLDDPNFIVNKSVLEELQHNPFAGGNGGADADEFGPLSDEAWASLPEVGSMRLDHPIDFSTGSSVLPDRGKQSLAELAPRLLQQFQGYRLAVCGHTGQGDEAANRVLSLARAQAVVDHLVQQYQIDPDRLHAEGLGSSAGPPKRAPGESYRQWQSRRSRVEFVLKTNNTL